MGLLGNAAEVLPGTGPARRATRHRHRPDQRARPGQRLPAAGWSLDEWEARKEKRIREDRLSRGGRAIHGRACPGHAGFLDHRQASRPSTTATTSARWRKDGASTDAFDFPGFVPAYIRPLFCRGVGPFRWAALSGDPEDIYRTDAKVKELIPDDPHLHTWLDMARGAHPLPGTAVRGSAGWASDSGPPAWAGLQRDGRFRASCRRRW